MNNHLLDFFARIILKNVFDVQVSLDGPLPERNYIIASNHLSWIDPIIVHLFWPNQIPMMFIGPRDVITNTRWKRWIVNMYPQIVLTDNRSGWMGLSAYKKVIGGLTEGTSLLIFPEGDFYHEEGDVKPLFNGVARFALTSNVPILPIGLCGTAELYYRKQLFIRIGDPIDTFSFLRTGREQVPSILNLVREKISSLIAGYQDPMVIQKPMRWLTKLM